uniref:Uncharacterized protein n=1 Tax=Streptomyces auratus AGR0001 TaxID=1160718 RepID=J1RV12_9ACTN
MPPLSLAPMSPEECGEQIIADAAHRLQTQLVVRTAAGTRPAWRSRARWRDTWGRVMPLRAARSEGVRGSRAMARAMR